ncbi:MAG: outer membrane lipoprotein chaperone LolA [Steroidobacteraceae bacterium]|nr:outer membrane lipoprotein chaperone LolA [Steroidobacteraceae bacterium]
MPRTHRWLGVLLASLSAGALAPAASGQDSGDAVSRIEAYLATVNTLSASFSQVVRNRDGQIVDKASGTLALSRPDRFRWDYEKPYLQTIVADGKRLWLYDSDLEQVTVRALEQGLGSTPAMLLSGSGKVGDAFTSAGVQRQGDWTWYRLAPKQAGSDFERVSLAFDRKGELAAMELGDKLGQVTVIEFGAPRRNVALDQRLFRFEPPPGADVIGRAEP